MRVRMLTVIAGPLGTWQRDQEADLPDAMALDLIKVSAAVAIDPPGKLPEAAVVEPEEMAVLPSVRRPTELPPHRRRTAG